MTEVLLVCSTDVQSHYVNHARPPLAGQDLVYLNGQPIQLYGQMSFMMILTDMSAASKSEQASNGILEWVLLTPGTRTRIVII